MLDQLEFGSWFDFDDGEGKPRRRLKLAWYTQVTGHYMFVDSLGVKAAVKSRRALFHELNQGRAHFVQQEKRPFVDRAMEAVRHLLRREEAKSA